MTEPLDSGQDPGRCQITNTVTHSHGGCDEPVSLTDLLQRFHSALNPVVGAPARGKLQDGGFSFAPSSARHVTDVVKAVSTGTEKDNSTLGCQWDDYMGISASMPFAPFD